MNDSVHNSLRESSWRRRLSPEEEAQLEAWLAEHPGDRADWEADRTLTQAIGRFTDVPLASNFTAQVLQAIERDRAAERRRRSRLQLRWWLRLMPKAALALIMASAGFVCFQESHKARLRAEIRRSVVAISTAKSLPSTDLLKDFEAIRLSAEPAADEKLLTLLQ